MMYHNSTDNTGDSWTEDIISILKKKVSQDLLKTVSQEWAGSLYSSDTSLQQQTGHLPLFIHGTEPTIESTREPTFCKSDTETRDSSNTTWLERKSRSLITSLQEHNSLISTDFRLRDLPNDLSVSYTLVSFSIIEPLTPDGHFTYTKPFYLLSLNWTRCTWA